MEKERVHYKNLVMDSAWWDGFEFREGDIIISTPPKCGTTWTQMITALLIFQTTDFPAPLDVMSPWLDQLLHVRESVFTDLAAQGHRRFIKSHCPYDGLPIDERVTYICVGRDSRDVGRSWDNHVNNLDIQAFLALRQEAVGNEDLVEVMANMQAPAETEHERFWQWVADPDSLAGMAGVLHHLDTFWQVRNEPNIVLLHYAELKEDLEGQMRALAGRLGIEVRDAVLLNLAHAASFEEMKKHASNFAPNATKPIWQDTDRFFHKGTSGQWRDLLDDDDLERYEAKVNELIDADLSTWIHQGPITAGD